MMASKKEKTWFVDSLIGHWQSYLTSLFEEDEYSDDSDLSGKLSSLCIPH